LRGLLHRPVDELGDTRHARGQAGRSALRAAHRCALYGLPGRPEVCIRLEPSIEMCGENAEQAMAYLAALEAATDPGGDAARLDSDGRARAER